MGTPASGSPASGPKVEQDLDFQRREWTFQRIGWAVMLAIVVVGLLGLFATGPLSRTTVTNADRTLRVSFEGFTRFGAPTQLVIDVPPGAIGGGEARIALSRDYLTAFQVQAVAPEAERVEAAGADLVYVFKVDQGSGARGDVQPPGGRALAEVGRGPRPRAAPGLVWPVRLPVTRT